MTKISYTNLKLKTNTEVKVFTFEDKNIEVLQYLPFEDKYALITNVLQNSLENGVYNPLLVDMYFHLYLVYLYTNISFTDKQKEDGIKIYNNIKSTGLLELVLSNIPDSEYNTLMIYTEELSSVLSEYNRSIVSLVSGMIQDMPKQAQEAMNIVNNFDKNKFQEIINFVKAANGGRDI